MNYLGLLKTTFALPNDDPRKVVAVAIALCLVCSIVVSSSAVLLKPLQQRNALLALKREVLLVAGIYQPEADIESQFQRIETRLVSLSSGEYFDAPEPMRFAYRNAAKDPSQSTQLSSTDDIANIKSRADLMPVYLVRDDQDIETVILPVYGYGLWSTMHGLLALAKDGRTIKALSFYEHRETAGLGSEIANPTWNALWKGKLATDETGKPAINVVKGAVDNSNPAADYQVDGLAGATLTGDGVTYLMRFWLGELGFGPYLDRLRKGEA
jgi:Na+-transporting NADH:ubiquinone oxidoreductase subunit C